MSSLPIPITPINNGFAALQESDDEDEMLMALQQLTANIQIGPKKSQKQKKLKPGLTKREISDIAGQIAQGKIDLPSLDLDSNSEYEAVWALVDSGAGKSCANKAKHFKHVKTRNAPSNARMATANGQELISRGTFRVKGRTSEGQEVEPNFEDADVDMPIVAVNDLSQENTEVIFRKGNSELLDVHTGRRSRFAKQRGVYFMKIYYKKGQDVGQHSDERSLGFTRPGAP